MKRFTLAFATFMVATGTGISAANATPGVEALQRGKLERGSTTSEQLSQIESDRAPHLTVQPQRGLENAAAEANARLREKLEKDAIIDVVVFDL